ncbi:unnamed protein product [Allacma fusca]|uniref:MARVEL domain-containing protein n=1 Tax=Allacma fusca TaxID=39272 RepID=A0A8J2PDU3_9HEXA|nr:unnamed protein product [Allacma fusca]
MAMKYHAVKAITFLKLILNIIIIILYKHGDEGYFLGASFNKSRDAETLAAGIYVGFLIYNLINIISNFFDQESVRASVSEILWNAVGFILWLIAAGVVIHFWLRFIPANHYLNRNPKAKGIAMGSLTIVNSCLYLGEGILAFMNYRKSNAEKY